MSDDDLIRKIKEGTSIPWWERALLEETYHKEMVKEHGTSQVGRPDSLVGKRGWAIKDSATLLSLSVGFLCEDLQLAKEVRNWPELKEYNRETALNLLRLKKKGEKHGRRKT